MGVRHLVHVIIVLHAQVRFYGSVVLRQQKADVFVCASGSGQGS